MGDRVKRTLTLSFLLACALLYLGESLLISGQGQTRGNTSLSRWRPARDLNGVGYVGASACAECHAKEARTQLTTPMGHASERAADCEVLKTRAPLTFRNGPYTYRITRDGDRSIYTVGDGAATISEPVLFCFGQGVAGQTYIFRHGGTFYESRVSYFPELRGLDITIQHPRAVPASLEDALGRPVSLEAAEGCFSCHTTPSAGGARLTADRRLACVACHDPHDQLRRDDAYYDSKCLACHLSSAGEAKTPARSAPACPVAAKQCATCHMPKVELPEMHYKFTDHWIRVVRPGEAVPR